jgi:hypothetical protein
MRRGAFTTRNKQQFTHACTKSSANKELSYCLNRPAYFHRIDRLQYHDFNN